MSDDLLQANSISVHECTTCAARLVLYDEFGEAFAVAHLSPEVVEELIADIRCTAATGAARRRPLA